MSSIKRTKKEKELQCILTKVLKHACRYFQWQERRLLGGQRRVPIPKPDRRKKSCKWCFSSDLQYNLLNLIMKITTQRRIWHVDEASIILLLLSCIYSFWVGHYDFALYNLNSKVWPMIFMATPTTNHLYAPTKIIHLSLSIPGFH